MQAPDNKPIEFRFGLQGVVSKAAPDLLKDGQYRSLLNVQSNQEGALSSRTGIKQVGLLTSTEPTCYHIRKLRVGSGENPLVPSANPRYLGVLTSGAARNIYRTLDYSTKTLVASGVDSSASKHWEMTDYSAGETGAPWAYFACPNAMLKDSGSSPYSTLRPWGIQPAGGVAMAVKVTGSVSVTASGVGISGTSPVILYLASGTGLADADEVAVLNVGVVPNTCPTGNGKYYAKVIGYSNSASDPYYAYGQAAVFALYDSDGKEVPVTGSFTAGGSVTNVPLLGNLDGGSQSSPNNTQPYDWVYTYLEADTSDEGNPSQAMSAASTATQSVSGLTYSGVPLLVHGGIAKVLIWGIADTARFPTINVYRRGGTLYDTWRLVANIGNPGVTGGVPNYATFQDNTADADLVLQKLIEVDNNPPITSTVPNPIKTTLSGAVATGFQTASLSASVFGSVTPGSRVHVLDSLSAEDVYILSATGNTFVAYFQFAHASGTPIEVDQITGQPCNLTATIGDALLVAGDPNNPHILSKSKNGRPQAFPVGTDAAGAVTSLGVGSPSNGIRNLCEYRGQALCLNVSSLFEVPVIQGSLIVAVKVADKGLAAQSAWCKTESEVWYLSDDGVYSWDGGIHRKRTRSIDAVFHSQYAAALPGQYANNIAPLDYANQAGLQAARMEYHRGVVRLLYTDVNGKVRELACEPAYGDRWVPYNENQYQPPINPPEYPITAMYEEPDTKSLVLACANPNTGATFGIADAVQSYSDQYLTANLTSDWWTTDGKSGVYVPWDIRLPWFDMGNPTTKKLFEEIWLDLDPQLYVNGVEAYNSSITVELLLDYSDVAVETFTITVPSGNVLRGRQLVSLLPNLALVSGSTYQSYGREARAISFHLYGNAFPVPPSFYRLLVQAEETGLLTSGAARDWMDLGSRNDKRLYQMAVVFDTAGVDRQIVLETRGGRDGKTAGTPQVFTLSSPTDLGSGRCIKLFPLADPTIAKLMRVRPYSSAGISGGNSVSSMDLFRIFEVTYPEAEQYPPDIVSVTRWDAGERNDRNPSWLSVDMDTDSVPASVQLQSEAGTVLTVAHTGSVAARKANYAVPVDIYGKMWRLLNTPGLNGKAQLFSWALSRWHPFEQGGGEDPPEVVLWVPWSDFGYPYPKLARSLVLTIDTGGVACSIGLQTQEGGTVQTFQVTTTYITRRVVLACNPNLSGILWRLVLTPGIGGKAKLWDWSLDSVKQPPALTQWNSYPQALGYKGWKLIKEFWLDYVSAQTVTFTFTSDTGTYSIVLPAHPTRAVERYLLPPVWGAGYNKSRLYSFGFTSAGAVQIYADCSGVRWIPCGQDHAAEYVPTPLSEFMQVVV